MSHNPYLPTDLDADARFRVFAFPYAGGGAAMYFRWRKSLPAGIDLVPVLLPGREGRIAESPRRSMQSLVCEIADALTPLVVEPYALLGHSMGAWIAFELARELRRRSARMPAVLVATASPAPQRPRVGTPVHTLEDQQLVTEIERRFDGIPSAVKSNSELLELLLPAIRADMELLETYQYLDEPPLAADVVALGGTDDRAIPATALADWRQQTAQAFASRLWPGGHFFLFQPDERSHAAASPAFKWIASRLERYVP
jgi:surfactin synthase thioesterase subunit